MTSVYQQSSLKEIQNTIKDLENTDLKDVSIDDIKEKLIPLFKGYVLNSPKIKMDQKLQRKDC